MGQTISHYLALVSIIFSKFFYARAHDWSHSQTIGEAANHIKKSDHRIQISEFYQDKHKTRDQHTEDLIRLYPEREYGFFLQSFFLEITSATIKKTI